MADYEFRYSPLTGRLTGKQMIEQTEQAINHLSSLVDSAAGQVEIISTLANEANENAATALETAEEALATTGRTYITVSTQTNANNYYDSQLIYIADSTSTNIPVADTGMLEVKTNDNKTACEQVFISDSSGDAYYRNGAITAETVGDVTTYTVTWGGWSSQPASQAYVQGELANYLPLSGGTVTGGLTVKGTITGNLAGNADTATNATNATNDTNGNPIADTYFPLSGGSITGDVDITGDLSVSGAIHSSSGGVLPGTVTAFSGTFKDGYPVNKNTGLVDEEWHLCDGTNGTPDLRNRFIYGGNGTNNGATGGEANHKLTKAELPKIIGDAQFRLFDENGNIMGNMEDDASKSGVFSQVLHGGNKWYSSLQRGPTATANTDVLHLEFGENQPHNNMPPYYVLSFIMKL